MKTIFIHYFTGTGNTAHSVKMIAEKLKQNDFKVELFQVKKGTVPPSITPDFHIVAFPVLSWAAPVLMKKYLSMFSPETHAPTSILAVQGALMHDGKIERGYSGQALEEIEKMLRRKNYEVFYTAVATFPDNWTQVTNPCSPEEIEQIFTLGNSEVEQFITNFLHMKHELFRCGTGNKIWTYLTSLLFGLIGRRILGKFYIADDHCTGCEICVKSCPVSTIRMDAGKPWWGTHCEDCNRCINICPEKAIQVSVPLFIIQTIISISLTIWAIVAILRYSHLLIDMPEIYLIYLEIALIIAASFLLLWVSIVPIDAFLRLLMKIPRVRKFFSKSYTAGYRRYIAPGFKPLAKL